MSEEKIYTPGARKVCPAPAQEWSHDTGPHGPVTFIAGELHAGGESLIALHGWDAYLKAALDSHRDIAGVREELAFLKGVDSNL